MKRKQLWIVLLTLVALLLVIVPAAAQEADPTPSDDEVNAVAKNMFCPVCENTPLDVCATAACAQWREEIRILLAEGKTEDEIYTYFETKYGDRVLSAPPAEGFNLFLYAIPPALILIAIAIVIRTMLVGKKAAAPVKVDKTGGTPTIPAVDNDVLSRLEAELKDRDE